MGDVLYQTGPVIEELVASARSAPEGLVTRLVCSSDADAARLGRAIRHLRDMPSEPGARACDGSCVIDPVTHDPAW